MQKEERIHFNEMINAVDCMKLFQNQDRFQLVEFICQNPDLTTSFLAETLKIRHDVTSNHLSRLLAAKMITKRKVGKNVYHRIAPGYENVRNFVRNFPTEEIFRQAQADHLYDEEFAPVV